MAAKRIAQLVATAVSVLCPYCGAEQPNPDNGADSWMFSEVEKMKGPRTCVSCDAGFTLEPQSKVMAGP